MTATARPCPRSGKPVSQALRSRAIYVAGRGWLARCPTCGTAPGAHTDGAGVVRYDAHDRPAS